jgi:hypothetical protein
MNQNIKDQLTKTLIKNHEELLDGDGHSILPSEYYTELEVPQEVLEGLKKKIESNHSDHKTTIFKDGQIVDELIGIWNLEFLERVATLLSVKDYQPKIGRGFQAQEICSAIRRKLGTLRNG